MNQGHPETQQLYHLSNSANVTGAPLQPSGEVSSPSIACDAFEVHCLALCRDLLVFLNASGLISGPQDANMSDMSDANFFGILGEAKVEVTQS